MKKILITGENSYIGTSVENWLLKEPDKYKVDTVDMIDGSWKNKDFSKYDVVFHVAGIAHISTDSKLEELYYKVNRDLAIDTAMKAKTEGVKQFIFMSSINVYGDGRKNSRVIDRNTMPAPSSVYGKSKLQAEKGIKKFEDEGFKVAVLRPPFIYGKGCKGNYQKLSKAARRLPIFPDINNERSMLHIDNLCEFIRLIINNEESGLFFPQNTEYVKTSEMVRLIAEVHGKKIRLTKLFNPILRMMYKINYINKIFGSLAYDKKMSVYERHDYRVRNFVESIELTEETND